MTSEPDLPVRARTRAARALLSPHIAPVAVLVAVAWAVGRAVQPAGWVAQNAVGALIAVAFLVVGLRSRWVLRPECQS